MKLNRLAAILVVFAVGMTDTYAQFPDQMPRTHSAEVSSSELEQFAHAFREIQVINRQLQMDMLNTLQQEGIDVDRFNEYLNTQQDPAQKFNATEVELQKFAKAYQDITEIQILAHQEILDAITGNDLTLERYREIVIVVQANSELIERLQQYFEEQLDNRTLFIL